MKAGRFYGGVALLTFSTLMLEILETRLLSVIAWYHLAFFVISAAMFGMTAGAIWVHRRGDRLTPATLPHDLSRLTRGFAVTSALSVAFQCTLGAAQVASATLVVVYLELALALAVPFFMSGAAVSLALTRSPFPIGRVYAADLAGAAMGCLGVLVILRFADAVSAIVWTGAIAALAAAWFGSPNPTPPARRGPAWLQPIPLASILLLVGAANTLSGHGLQPVVVKDQTELRRQSYMYEKWNSFSRVIAMRPRTEAPFYWGASSSAPMEPVRQIWMNIDGDAATVMVPFHGDTASVGFLHYDVTSLAYAVRPSGRAVVMGLGSGRDLLSAWTAGMRDITGVELNPIFVDLLTRREPFRSFAGLADLPNVRFVVDDARSWAARRPGTYDVVEMSMVDTFAATGAGAFSLSENGLYTLHSWRNFIALLSPQGVFTVSRWYSPGLVNETGRLLSLATGALLESGVAAPERHLFLAAAGGVATLLLFRGELGDADRERLEQFCALRGYHVLLSPGHASPTPLLQGVVSSRSMAELRARTSGLPLDLTPPTDDRPFFFNVLPLLRPLAALRFMGETSGVLRGNMMASVTLLIILIVSLALVAATILVPLRPAIRQVGRSLVVGGTSYFALLGFGFMCVEMGLLQRCSMFLGHPVYSLSVVLFSLILSTGLGSWLTDRWRLDTTRRFLAWSLPLAGYLASLPFWLATTFDSFEQADILARCVLAAAVVTPAGVLMGFGFPTGMSLASARDARPTAWFWGVNGAAGVLASVLSVALSIIAGIHLTLWIGAACYLLLVVPARLIGFPLYCSAVADHPLPERTVSRFYITTAIDYVNGRPHLGHAYEKVLADAIARRHRQKGDATYYLTGTDEHGQKIARAAAAAGKTPAAFVDELSQTFVEAWKALDIQYDQFFRTTDPRHSLAVQELFRRLKDALSPKTGRPVLYEEAYEGLYCEGCEAFKTDKDLDEQGRCPEHKVKPKLVKETNFFFRLSEYDEALLKHLEAHPDFIWPDYRRNEVVNVIQGGLQDTSVSRPNLAWGIPLPGEIEGGEGHVAYVWADALLNYLSAIGWPERKYSLWWLAKQKDVGGPGAAREDEFKDLDGQGRPGAAWAGTKGAYSTNAFHLIGKDISRFHCVLWPALLLAAGVPLPRQVYVHGFIYARGERLSKSLGNLVDPVELARTFGADALRFYLLDSFPTGRDGEFTVEHFVEHVNTHLANKLGNLASRSVTLVHRFFGGRAPALWNPDALASDDAKEGFGALLGAAATTATESPKAWEELRINEALDHVWNVVERANEFVDRTKPWELGKDPARNEELATVLNTLLETLRLVAIWAWPVLPARCEALWALLALPGNPGQQKDGDAQPRFGAGDDRALGESQILFPRIDLKSVAGA